MEAISMATKKYEIIGKTPQMRTVFIKVGDKLVQKPIKRGISFILSEEEMTFHVERQAARKILKIVEIVVEDPPVPQTMPPVTKKKSRSRKKSTPAE